MGRRLVPKTCPGCGIEYQPTQRTQVYCSRACYSAVQSSRRGERATRWQGGKVAATCANCGRQLKRLRSEIQRSERFFCDVQCRGKWMSTHNVGDRHPQWKGEHLETVCANCGAPISIPKWHASREQSRFFCSRGCFGAWASANLTGEKRYQWKGGRLPYYGPDWNKQKAAARKRDNYICQHCGKQEHRNSRALHVHHIVPFRTFGYVAGQNENHKAANDLPNLVTLCASCHRGAETMLDRSRA